MIKKGKWKIFIAPTLTENSPFNEKSTNTTTIPNKKENRSNETTNTNKRTNTNTDADTNPNALIDNTLNKEKEMGINRPININTNINLNLPLDPSIQAFQFMFERQQRNFSYFVDLHRWAYQHQAALQQMDYWRMVSGNNNHLFN